MSRVQKLYGAEIWAVSAEQHYILVQTDKGEELVLYRFSDAVRDLARTTGMQVHRSHWVSLKGIQDLKREGSAYELMLKSGKKIPVSRSYKKDVEAWDLQQEISSPS
ncbi:LytTR family DNA-binding domain-containing protein [Kiloniella sp.]|uniref:LytTR family DNA-binding domain-containing protein n=1 Tax=Kiloniella sp. TaxID=1938587 RepID=UPI003B028F5F